MEPMKPQEREEFKRRGVTDAEIDEYDALLTQRFAVEPGSIPSAEVQRKYDRLVELSLKILKR